MSEIKFPVKINKDAEKIAAKNLPEIVDRYTSRSGPQSEFVRCEINIICSYVNEKPFPNIDLTQTVLIGSWKRHPESGLYVRIGITPSESENGLDSVSLF